MLEFVKWLAAMELADGIPVGIYQLEYRSLLQQGQLDSLLENPVAAATIDLAEELEGQSWKGTPTNLLERLEKFTNQRTSRSRGWPLNAIALSKQLRSLQAGLSSQGIDVEFARGKHRTISIKFKGGNNE
jgi:hypothetical protein